MLQLLVEVFLTTGKLTQPIEHLPHFALLLLLLGIVALRLSFYFVAILLVVELQCLQ